MAPTRGGTKSQSSRTIILKTFNGSDQLELPCQVCTTVAEIREIVCEKTLMQAGEIDFYYKAGAYITKQKDHNTIAPVSLVKGISGFSAQKMTWPHPIGIIGQGYHGLKTAMTYLMDNNTNIVCFDRFDRVGGYCWITGANKTSRLQTEFGSFHIWWGQHCIDSGKVPWPDCNGSGEGQWHVWPYKEEILRHFHYAAERFGVLPYVHFQTNVVAMEIVGDKAAESRYYKLMVENLKPGMAPFESNVSVIYNYPGSLTRNRIIDYPGEDTFDGEIRYGMNDDTPYEKLTGQRTAILGNGAFAVENARTCIECGGTKAYIVTRRKNLASPRMPCWFVHQGPIPTPGGFVLKMFEPMYQLVDFGDPWKFWSVHANADRTNVTILQNSRFGIGDVTFLMCAWGLLEYVEAVVKRFSRHCLHLSTGEKLENVTVCLKALGLLGDYAVDKLHGMKEMVGSFCAGDWRRVIMIDATGMNAANFTTFSTGIGTTDFALSYKFLHDYPREYYKIESQGFMKTLPRHKEEPEVEKPAYVTDVKYSMTGGIILEGMCPKISLLKTWMSEYKYKMYHKAHTTKRALEVAKFEWDKYQEDWKSRGYEHEYVRYPYTEELMDQYFQEWGKLMQIPLSSEPKELMLQP